MRVARIDVRPDDLLTLARQVELTADRCDRRRLAITGLIAAQAASGGPIAGAALDLGAAADEAVVHLVSTCHTVVTLLRASAGVYTEVDVGSPPRQRNPAMY